MYEEGAPPPIPNSGVPGWVWGCGAGCAVLLLIGIVAAVGAFYAMQGYMDEARVTMQQELEGDYQAWIEQACIPDEQLPMFEEMMTILRGEDVGMMGVTMATFSMDASLKDCEISAPELAALEDAVRILRENPAPSPVTMGNFMERHGDILEKGFEENAADMPEPAEEPVPAEPAAEADAEAAAEAAS